MIVCPNCNHHNPDGAVQCEACYTPLPATTNCPNCGANVQADAAFCGQCGYNLHSTIPTVAPTVAPDIPVEVPASIAPDPLLALLQPDALGISESGLPATTVAVSPVTEAPPIATESSPAPPTVAVQPMISQQGSPMTAPETEVAAPPAPETEVAAPPPPETEAAAPPPPPEMEVAAPPPPPEMEVAATQAPPTEVSAPMGTASKTQLQQVTARLVHVQSDMGIELPPNLSVIHIGKPNDRIPPDIDVSGFASSEIVSRIHADIRVEGDACYIEDVGSSNGTYINNLPLLPGNRHKLRPGDRISLGKGDMMTFLFQMS